MGFTTTKMVRDLEKKKRAEKKPVEKKPVEKKDKKRVKDEL